MLSYFLQVNICWLLFYGVYYALLSRETFFKLNRIYLIISLLCGLVIPIVVPKMDMPIVQPLVEVVQPITVSVAQMQELLTAQTIETQPTTLEIWTILMKLYSLGMAFFLLKFCWGLVTIFKLYRSGKKMKNSDFSLIYTEGVKTPFSFFNWIFVNQNTVENADFQHIITHEQAHVRQKHSFDILGLEILRGAFWVSPLVHLYARSLRNVHEYLADAAVLQNTQKQSYGRLLINQTAAGSGLVLANHLNFSQLKKRIIMMSRNPSQRVALVKYTFAAPIFLLIVALLASPKTKILASTEGVISGIKSTVEKVDNQLFKSKNKRPKVSVEGTEEGWVLPQNLAKVKALNINEGYEIVSFKMAINKGDGYPSAAIYKNTGSVFEGNILSKIQSSKSNDFFHFIDILIKDLKTNETYIYGDCYLNVIDKIPSYMVQLSKGKILLKMINAKGETMEEQKIGIKELPSLDKLSFDGKYELTKPITVSISDGNIPAKTIKIENKGLTFSDATKEFIRKAHVGQGIMFHIECKGEDGQRKDMYWQTPVIDKDKEENPFLMLPKGKKSGYISLNELKDMDYLIAKVTEQGETRTLKILKFKVLLTSSFFTESPSFHSKKEAQEIINIGANFSEALKKLLASAEEGDEIVISSDEVFDKEKNKNVATRGMILTIKN